MKKKISHKNLAIIIILVIFIAIFIFGFMAYENHHTNKALSYKHSNLEEALKEEKIDYDLKGYKETKDQVTIYLFRGKGCGVCRSFLTFLNSIVKDYGKYFKVVSFETWNDADNKKLLNEVATFTGVANEGVPYIVIGDEVFGGYYSGYDEDIKKAIMDEYKSKDRYDVFAEMNNSKKELTLAHVIALDLVFTVLSTCGIVFYIHYENKKLLLVLDNYSVSGNDVKKKVGKRK